MNKSRTFIGGLTGLDRSTLTSPHVMETYLGKEGEVPGTYFYILVAEDTPSEFIQTLSASPKFASEESVLGGKLFSYTLTEEERTTVVEPYLQGKYSEVSRDYVDKHFPKDVLSPTYNVRMVFDKHPNVIKYWSDKGVEIPEDAEVWSRPDASQEIVSINL